MKKRFFSLCLVLLLLASCLLAFSSCSEEELPTRTLHVYNWGQYISDGSYDLPDVNALFEEYFNEQLAEKYGYRIEVNYSTYPSNEDMYNKIASGSGSFDVIVPSEYMIEKMISENLLLELDFSKITNYEYIAEEFRTDFNTYDPEGKYTVPYTYGTVGIIYNTDYVDEEDIGSWDLLWNEKYSGKILQFNNSRDALATALYRLGYSVNTTDHTKWAEATELLKQQKPLVQAYVMDEIFNKMISGSAWIAPYYAGDFLTMYDSNDSLAFYTPKEGTNIFVDAMCVPTCARQVDAAMEYINFMLSEEPALANAEYLGYSCPNTLVTESEEYQEYMLDWHEESLDILYSKSLVVDDYTDLKDINAENKRSFFHAISNTEENGNLLDYTNSLWAEIKIESSIEPWIIVTDIVILALLFAWWLSSFLRKRAREKSYTQK
ncbi:MAG: spermidine/putrescine ABC transporter substrate-binding protein [Clostridia bacterium]|nr:spermidine/putrescine ABC transporter substrate-binding protein [Clostridia bacterium]